MTFFILQFKIRENSLKFAKNSLKFANFKMQNEECHHYEKKERRNGHKEHDDGYG